MRIFAIQNRKMTLNVHHTHSIKRNNKPVACWCIMPHTEMKYRMN